MPRYGAPIRLSGGRFTYNGCGLDAFYYQLNVIKRKYVGIPPKPIVGSYSAKVLRSRGMKDAKVVFNRGDWGRIKHQKHQSGRRAGKNMRFVDQFIRRGNKWFVRMKTGRVHVERELKMFDLIQIGEVIKDGKPWSLHFVVWLGGKEGWITDSVRVRKHGGKALKTIKDYIRKRGAWGGADIIVNKIIRSPEIEKAIDSAAAAASASASNNARRANAN